MLRNNSINTANIYEVHIVNIESWIWGAMLQPLCCEWRFVAQY